MKKLSKQQITIFIIFAGILLVVGVNWIRGFSAFGLASKAPSRTKGNPNAPIQIVEYIDFQCPACAKGSKMLKNCMEKYPDKFHLEMKYYPLGMHQHAFVAALYAQCAANQNKFWPFQDLVIERQDQWKTLLNAAPAFEDIAKEVGLDQKQLEVCVKDATVSDKIFKEKENAAAIGIQSTPTYFVNKKMVVGFKILEQDLADIFKQSNYGEFNCPD